MAFRADEAEQQGLERALRILMPRDSEGDDRLRSKNAILDLVDSWGPVVEHYPSWHPLVSASPRPGYASMSPNRESGYKGLDHTIYFAHAFITCPYGDEWKKVIESVESLPMNPAATIRAEKLDCILYNSSATPVLVSCNWKKILPLDKLIPKSIAVPLMLEVEVPNWRHSEVAECWDTMKPYLLGAPHGSRSSLFVNQETGQVIKSIWNSIINTGMFGPIMVDR